jgi:hypothetical protein
MAMLRGCTPRMGWKVVTIEMNERFSRQGTYTIAVKSRSKICARAGNFLSINTLLQLLHLGSDYLWVVLAQDINVVRLEVKGTCMLQKERD